ncbi:MAG: PAS domain S-box protein [Candidatus Competibacteraceae bacterium]|nr:PAS domain S-box protein [Candidatus Competibacteraceae bacterium]
MPTEILLFPTTLPWILIGALMVGASVLAVFQRRTIAALRRHGGQKEQQLQERVAQAERDLAERHQALESLQKSEEKYRTLADFTYDWEYWIDPDGRYVYVSPACERITGYRPEEFLADPKLLLTLVHPEDRDRVTAHHLGDRNPHEILDFRLIARNGRQVWIGHVCQAVHGRDGRYLGQRGSNRDITARKQTEAALRISEERYRQIVETSHEGIWAVDDEQRTTFVNWRMMDLLGYAPEEMFGQQFESFLFPEDLDAHRAQRERRFQGENSVYERRFRRKDGQTLWTSVSATALRDQGGKVTGAFAMLTDITERKRVEEALRESENLLRGVLNSLTAHIAVLDAQGTIILVNDAWQRFAQENDGVDQRVGFGVNYLITCQNAIDRDHDALAQAALRGIRAVLDGERPYFDLEYPCDAPTEPRWFIMRVHTLNDARQGVVVAHESITDRKRVEQALRRQIDLQEQLARINATVPGVICSFHRRPDGSAFFPYASPAIEDLFGLKAEAVTTDATPLFALIHQDDLQQVNASIAESARDLSPWRHEFRIQHLRKGERWIEGHSVPQVESDGGILWHGFVTDITDRKSVEQALRNTLEEKETLLREVHHRVKNNLAAIIGLLDLQRDAAKDVTLLSLLDQLIGRVRSMALVHEMLYQSEHLNRIDFHGYLQALIDHLCGSFDPYGAVRVEVAASGISMNLDIAIPCGLIVNELVINAFKHAFPKSRTALKKNDCLIKITVLQENPLSYTLTVADNGVGLPADLDWTTTRSLGLRLVRMLGQHQLQGSLELDRMAGTRFSLRFDVHQGDRSVSHGQRNDSDR